MPSANSESFILLFQFGFLFCFFFLFPALTVVAKTSKTMLNSNGESGQPCLVPDFGCLVPDFTNLEKEEWNWRNQTA